MHCPSCGQQQVSNETKFCSRCGLPLGLVSEVLMHGGFLPQLAELNKKKSHFTKKNGVVFSIFWFIFFTCFLTAVLGIAGAPNEAIGILAVLGVFGAFMFMIASLIFLPSSLKTFPWSGSQVPPPPNAYELGGPTVNAALPPQQSVPASFYAAPAAGHWRDTNDLQPTTVTDGTTKLLEIDDRNQ